MSCYWTISLLALLRWLCSLSRGPCNRTGSSELVAGGARSFLVHCRTWSLSHLQGVSSVHAVDCMLSGGRIETGYRCRVWLWHFVLNILSQLEIKTWLVLWGENKGEAKSWQSPGINEGSWVEPQVLYYQLSGCGYALVPPVHIEDCVGWWLSGCCSSVVEHWPEACTTLDFWWVKYLGGCHSLTLKLQGKSLFHDLIKPWILIWEVGACHV